MSRVASKILGVQEDELEDVGGSDVYQKCVSEKDLPASVIWSMRK